MNPQLSTQENASDRPSEIASKIEILAKLYLESNPGEISEETIAQMCDWLWRKFYNLPPESTILRLYALQQRSLGVPVARINRD